MATDFDKILRNLIRTGRVSTINPAKGTIKVFFPDKDNTLSADILIINRGSSKNKDYWLPDIGEQVVCLLLPNGNNAGYCLGSHFSDDAPPQLNDLDKRRIDFSDGTYIEYDRKTHELNINCVGEIKINGKKIFLN